MAELSEAEIDRDALLQAIGFIAGPLGDGARRKVILGDAGGLRSAMVAARRKADEHEGAASCWWLSCAEGRHEPLLLRVWKERQAARKLLRAAVAELQRITDAAEMLARETKDPGSEALAAIYSAREALRRAGLGPIVVAPLLDEQMFWFLTVLDAAGGDAPASDDPGEWVAAFCNDREPTDTYNLAEDLGFTRTTHDNRFDNSTVSLTPLGRDALALDSRSGGAPVMTHPLRATQHCRHYSYERDRRGILFGGEGGGPTCARGVDLRTEPGAAFKCMPTDGFKCQPPCGLREDFTDAERAAWKALQEESARRTILICAAIPSDGLDGDLPCPGCGTGTVTWSRAPSNRHLAAACSTPHCFSVIQ